MPSPCRSLDKALPLIVAHPTLRRVHLVQCDLSSGAMRLLAQLLAANTPLARLHIVRCQMSQPTRWAGARWTGACSHSSSAAHGALTCRSRHRPANELPAWLLPTPWRACRAAEWLAAGLATNRRLLSLNYAANGAGEEGALAFAAALRMNGTLRHLNLSLNR